MTAPSAFSGPRTYSFVVIAVTILVIGAALFLNALIDPLWYFSGNRLTGRNEPFDERTSKANLYYRHRNDFDCILFGASSATTLDVKDIPNLRCFNFAFSGGTLEEFEAFGRYVKAVGAIPTTVIVAIDIIHLQRKPRPPKTPDFVRSLAAPPNFFKAYVSLGATEHSLRELLAPKYDKRFFSAGDFVGGMDPEKHLVYAPTAVVVPSRSHALWGAPPLDYVGLLRKTFPEARFIGFAPVISSWDTAEIYLDGQLKPYVAARRELAKKFDRFYDFSVPSPASEVTTNMLDGTHQTPQANAPLARILSGVRDDGVVIPDKYSDAQYFALYEERIAEFISRRGIRAAP